MKGESRPSLRNAVCTIAVLILGAAVPAAAAPITFDWTTTTSGNGTGTNAGRSFTDTVGLVTSVLKARAYATTQTNGNGDLISRNLGIYSGGLGVHGTSTDDPSTSPNHSLDSVGKNDLILFEFDSAAYNPQSISIGWKQGDADIQVWIGGPNIANLDLTNYAGCSGACTVSELDDIGFHTPALEYVDLALNTPRALNTTFTGRYMLVAARFEGGEISGGDDDYMKISLIVATTKVSEPGTYGLLLLGLFAAAFSRRRIIK